MYRKVLEKYKIFVLGGFTPTKSIARKRDFKAFKKDRAGTLGVFLLVDSILRAVRYDLD